MKEALSDKNFQKEFKEAWKRVFRLIDERNTTLYKFSQDIGLSYANLKKIVDCVNNDNIDTECGIEIFIKIAKYFNVPLNYIVHGMTATTKQNILDEISNQQEKNDYTDTILKIYPYLSLEKKDTISKLVYSFFKQ